MNDSSVQTFAIKVKLRPKDVDSLYDEPGQIRKVKRVHTYNNQEILTFAEGQDHNLLTQEGKY